MIADHGIFSMISRKCLWTGISTKGNLNIRKLWGSAHWENNKKKGQIINNKYCKKGVRMNRNVKVNWNADRQKKMKWNGEALRKKTVTRYS